ncbi:hypothetical protein QZH41_004039 [Actinostola sp. cb2023]|nr:hypothetical protein QZH41_004039 [Actinostola sp. cb2023]
MRSASHLLVMNLAVCDFFTPLVSIPFDFALEENDYAWFYGDFMCKILYPAATFSTTTSSLTLAAISLDRYRLLMHPFKRKLSSNQIKVIIVSIYVFSGALVSPYTYVLNVQGSSCGEHWPRVLYRQMYTMGLFLFQYAIPLIFMTVMYTLAIINLYSTSAKVKQCSIQGRSSRKYQVNGSPRKRGFLKVNFKSAFKRKLDVEENPNVRATKMFMAVVVVFTVFMFPNQILWLWVDYGNGSAQPNHAQTAIICWLFTYTNSVVNPIIFAIFSKEFRVGFKGVFRLIFCCNHEALPERCKCADCHTRSDSSTNEILKEKDKKHALTYEIMSHSNIPDNDILVKDDPNQLQNHALNHNSDEVLHCETQSVLKSRSGRPDPAKSLPELSALASQNTHDYRAFSTDAFQRQPTTDRETGQNQYDPMLPNLPPNTIAILNELPETDC